MDQNPSEIYEHSKPRRKVEQVFDAIKEESGIGQDVPDGH
jgi:hypothetical protein